MLCSEKLHEGTIFFSLNWTGSSRRGKCASTQGWEALDLDGMGGKHQGCQPQLSSDVVSLAGFKCIFFFFFDALNTTSRVSSKFIILITIQTSLTPTQSGWINRSKRKREECTLDLNFNYYFIMTLNHITTEVAPTHPHTHKHTHCAQRWTYPVEQRNVVEQVWVGEGKNTQVFAELWTLALRESEK